MVGLLISFLGFRGFDTKKIWLHSPVYAIIKNNFISSIVLAHTQTADTQNIFVSFLGACCVHVCIFWYTWQELKDVHVSSFRFCLGFGGPSGCKWSRVVTQPDPACLWHHYTCFNLCTSYWSLFRSKFGNVICAVNNGFNLPSS